jgi:hypothetical protein
VSAVSERIAAQHAADTDTSGSSDEAWGGAQIAEAEQRLDAASADMDRIRRELPAITGCGAYLPLINATCDGQPTLAVRGACVHEHIRDGRLCALHLLMADIGFCRICYEHDGHECPITLQVLDGAS